MDTVPILGGKPEESVPQVDPVDIKAVWQVYQDVQARNPGQQVAVGMGVLEHYCSKGANINAVAYRTGFLSLMVAHAAEMAPWIKDGQPDEALFRAIAETPMEWIAVGVVRQGPPFSEEEFMRRLRGEQGSTSDG
jgi:hypothetical protein